MDIKKQYTVEFTLECKTEIKKTFHYICHNLSSKIAAQRLLHHIENAAKNLAYTPKIYAMIDTSGSTHRIYRKIIISHYILLYTIDEKNKKVYISHLYYSGNNYLENL